MTLQDDLVALRRDLHRYPEVGLDLPRTQQAVSAALGALPFEITRGRALSSVTAVLRGGRPGPAVLLRADMDALPVSEAVELDYASRVDGVMHACGHDLHTAMLVGAARLLAERRSDLAGDVVLMFQPGEEGYGGAKCMIDEGVLDAAGERVSAAYALHVSSIDTSGVVRGRPGTAMAATHHLSVTVRGSGGHAAMPHLAHDPVVGVAEMITAIPTMVTRRFDVFDPVVVTVTQVEGSRVLNVIGEVASFNGTVRTFSPTAGARFRTEVTRLCQGIAAAHGLAVEVELIDGYPPTINDPGEFEHAAAVVRRELGAAGFDLADHPLTAAEDFSYVLNEVPGCFLHLGAGGPEPDRSTAPNHSPRALFDDSVLEDGARVLTALAVDALARHAR